MWIHRKTYDDLRLEWTKAHEEARVLAQQNQALTTTLDWFRVRITQLEMERAQLLWNYTGVKIPTPVIAKNVNANAITQTPDFADVGDAEAARLGISWAEDGSLVYAQQEALVR